MAQYANVKTLKTAIPVVNPANGNVIHWEIETIFASANGVKPAWSNTYSSFWNVESMGKTPESFTKEDLINSMPSVLDEVFSSHYETFARPSPSTPDRIPDFDITTLPNT